MGIVLAADSPTEIDKAEKGLISMFELEDWVSSD
jgi:hypothetical protein